LANSNPATSSAPSRNGGSKAGGALVIAGRPTQHGTGREDDRQNSIQTTKAAPNVPALGVVVIARVACSRHEAQRLGGGDRPCREITTTSQHLHTPYSDLPTGDENRDHRK